MAAMQDIEADGKDHRGSIQQASPIHRLSGGVHGRRPEREEHSDDGPDQSKDIGRNSPQAKLPWPVIELVATKTFPKDKSDGRNVRAQEAGHHKGDESIERFGGADVDEREEESDDGRHTNGNERKFGVGFDLSGRLVCARVDHPR